MSHFPNVGYWRSNKASVMNLQHFEQVDYKWKRKYNYNTLNRCQSNHSPN